MVQVELEDGSRQAVQVDGGGIGRSIIMRITRERKPIDSDTARDKAAGVVVMTLATLSLSADAAEGIENALRIQRRVAERRQK